MSDLDKRFLENGSDTGRHIITSLVTGKKYYVEVIGSTRPADWGSIVPGTNELAVKKGWAKHAGAIEKEESMITEENGFVKIEIFKEGQSPYEEISRRDKEYEKEMKLMAC